ncbi:MAG: flavin reductase family protein, partial [Variovorax sp.]
WRVRLQHYFPVGRFGASFYVKTRERYSLGAEGAARSTSIDEI